jgi:glucose/arabinose dehydrogenase
MTRSWATAGVALMAALTVCGCGRGVPLPSAAGYGPHPTLPAPRHAFPPTVNIAKVTGWTNGRTPVPAPGFTVTAFAVGLAHPRWLYVLTNGDVLVAETNGPASRPRGLRGWIEARIMAAAGAEVASPNRITLLRDTRGAGVADKRTVFLSGLNSPFGMALVGATIYVADTDAVLAFPYVAGQSAIAAPGVKLADLPGGPIDHHWTKNILASPDGARLYVSVGSNSNVGENGIAAETGRAAIWEIDRASGRSRIFASGLRNPNGMDWQPASGALWTVVNERDELGDDLVPDYLTSVRDGGFYGWPYSYWGGHLDERVKPQRPDLVARAIAPDYAVGSHTAPLGLVFYRGKALGPRFEGGAFIGQHGSWNRSLLAGYKVIFVPFAGGQPSGPPQDILAGFVDEKGRAMGRPVGLAEDKAGGLLVADDVGGVVWRISRPSAAETAPG